MHGQMEKQEDERADSQTDGQTNEQRDETELTQPCYKPIAQYMNQPLLMKQ